MSTVKVRIPTKYLPYLQSLGLFLGLLVVLFGMKMIGLFDSVSTYTFWALVLFLFIICLNIFQYLLFREHSSNAFIPDSFLESHELFLELYKQSPVPYLLIDGGGEITYTNAAAMRLFALEEHQLVGRNAFTMLTPPEETNSDTHQVPVESRFKQGVYVNDEDMLIKRDDDSTRWVLLSVFSYGRIKKNGLMTLVDVTKQKKIEKAKTEFVSLASHQLHTPISSMKWNMELLESKRFGELSEVQKKYIGKVAHALTRMEHIIKDFLNVSQLELGTFSSEPVEFTLSEFLDALIDEHGGRIEQKFINVVRAYDAGAVSLNTDKRLLTMSIGNLISNAAKYTPEEGTVTVSTKLGGSKGLIISVSDTGIGIPVDDQEQLFSKFFRAENARQRETDGTGLGLYIVKLAIETLGGSISFTSQQDVGTTFVVELPL